MDPAIAIPSHFILEFLGVAAFGGLAAWALQSGRRVAGAGALALLAAQVAHAGQFIEGEDAALVLGLRLIGLIVLAAGMRTATVSEGSVAPAAVATAPAQALGWLTAASAGVVALTAKVEDRRLWVSGWGAVAVSDAWVAAVGGGILSPAVLAPHLVRGAGFVTLGVWMWRRTVTSLRLRIMAAFALVLMIVVMVAAGTVARVVAEDQERQVLSDLATEAAAALRVLQQSDRELARAAANFASTREVQDLIASGDSESLRAVLSEPQTSGRLNANLILVLDAQGQILVQVGVEDPAVGLVVAGSEASEQALAGQAAVPLSSSETISGALVSFAVAPVFRAGAGPGPGAVVGGIAVGREIDDEGLSALVRGGNPALLVSPGEGDVIAASDPALSSATLPAEALQHLRDAPDEPWLGKLQGEPYFAAAVPLVRANSTVPAILVVVAPAGVLNRLILDVSQALFAAVLAAALLSVIIALWLGSRIARPVVRLTGTARRVEEGDLEAEPDISSTDEIGTLARAFGSMTSYLRDTIATEQATRQQSEAIVAGMGEGLVAMDPDFNITTFNEAAERITGVPAVEAVGRKCYDVYGHATKASDGKPICDSICPIRHNGGRDSRVDLPADRRTVHLDVTCSALCDPDGDLTGGVDLMRDVTTERQAEAMKTNILNNISHEIRTPLTHIGSAAPLLRRAELTVDKKAQVLNIIDKGVEDLKGIVQKLLDLASMQEGQVTEGVDLVRVRPQELLREAVEKWSGRSDRHQIRMVAPARVPMVMGDPQQLLRVLDELLQNAIKFSPQGGDVIVRARTTEDGVRISVTDRGVGVAPEDLENLEGVFVQADASMTRPFGGLGAGLALVKSALQQHGSSLEVTSELGSGSTFSFVLPKASAANRTRIARTRSVPSKSTKKPKSKPAPKAGGRRGR